jgi:hypothetical protein
MATDDDVADTADGISLEPAGEPAGAPEAGQVSHHQAHARTAPRDPVTRRFLSQGKGRSRRDRDRRDGPKPGHVPRRKSKISNGHALFFNGNATTAESRRFADVLSAIVSDLGGRDAPLSEGQRQLARRAASLSVACERLEQSVLTGQSSSAEAAFVAATGGLSPYAVLRDAGRALHGIARVRGGNSIAEMAKLPKDELDRVVDLLARAGDLASKSINSGSAQSADLQLLGELSDRCGRTFARLGMARTPKEVNALPYARDQSQVWSPLRASLAKAQENARPVDADALEPIDVTSEAAE